VGYVTNIPNDSALYYSVAVDSQGRIIVVGRTDFNNNNDDGLIARFNTDGTLDTTFNGTGFINIEGATDSSVFYSVAIDNNGKIIVAGLTDEDVNHNSNGLIARFNTNGTLDATLNNGAGFITNIPDSFLYYSVAIDNNGKIVAVGQTDDENGLIARFHTNGTLDATFNNGAGFITNLPDNSLIYLSVAVDNNGKILAVGQNDDFNGLIVRFNTNGTLDTTFNGTGFIANVLNNSSYYSAVAIDSQGRIMAVGETDNSDGILVRFLSNGVLDAESNWNLKNFRESKNINNVSIGLL
jgi:uncharacterized delta-60 repeat protein